MHCSAGHPSTEMIPLHGPALRLRPSFCCPVCHRLADFFCTVVEKGDFEKEEQRYEVLGGAAGGSEPCLAVEGEPPSSDSFATQVPGCSNGHPRVPMEPTEQPLACARRFRYLRCSERKLLVAWDSIPRVAGGLFFLVSGIGPYFSRAW